MARILHINGGTVGLLSGPVALSFLKGSRPHRVAGTVFFISMLTASAAGAYPGFRKSEMDNFLGGLLTFYLVATAWVTARRKEGETSVFDWIGLPAVSAIAAIAVTCGIEAAHSATWIKGGSPASGYVLPAGVALLAAIGDARIVLRGGLRGAQRIVRHLWCMCFALFAACASIFLARPQLLPDLLSKIHVLFVLGVPPLVLMVFWLARIMLTNAFRGTAYQTEHIKAEPVS